MSDKIATEPASSQTAGQRLEAALASEPVSSAAATSAVSSAPTEPVAASSGASPQAVQSTATPLTSGLASGGTATAAAATTEPAGQPAAQPSFLDRIKELGFADVQDEAAARDRLLEAYRAQREQQTRIASDYESMRMLAQYGQQFLQLAQDDNFRQFMSQRQGTPASQPAPAAERQPWWNPPQVDELLVREFQETKVDPATGAVTTGWKDETPAELKRAWQERQLYHRQWLNKVATDPVSAFQPILDQYAEQLEQRIIEKFAEQQRQAYSQQREQAVLGDIMAKHQAELIQLDPATKQPMRDLFGNYIHTPLGKQVLEAVNELAPVIPDQERLFEAAYNRAIVQKQAADMAALRQQLAALQAAQQQRQAVVARGATTPPNRNGSEPTATTPRVPKDRHLRPGDRLRETARRAGVSLVPVN